MTTNYRTPWGLIAGTVAVILFIAGVAFAVDFGSDLAAAIRQVIP